MGDERIGETIARRYRILETLGQGATGTVYKALDARLQRLVALKVLRLADAESKQRFLREADALARLNHPNILQVYGVGESEGLVYLAAEYIEGRSLRQIMAEGKPLDPDYAAELMRQVGTGLGYAHQGGVIHRDVKPRNILISNDGRVLLSDFGLAIAPGAPTLTETGTIAGTPAYMSPEQAMGRPVDARSDIFSLGIVFYELLTGRKPFSGESVFRNIVEATPAPPRQLNGAIPAAVEHVVMKSLAKDPRQRFQTAEELVAALVASATPRAGPPVRSEASAPVAPPAVAVESSHPADSTLLDRPTEIEEGRAQRVRSLVEEARNCLANADPAQAIAALERALQLKPNDPEMTAMLAAVRAALEGAPLHREGERVLEPTGASDSPGEFATIFASPSAAGQPRAPAVDLRQLPPEPGHTWADRRHFQLFEHLRLSALIAALLICVGILSLFYFTSLHTRSRSSIPQQIPPESTGAPTPPPALSTVPPKPAPVTTPHRAQRPVAAIVISVALATLAAFWLLRRYYRLKSPKPRYSIQKSKSLDTSRSAPSVRSGRAGRSPALQRCENGHFYDPQKHNTCPYCSPPDLSVVTAGSRNEIDDDELTRFPPPYVPPPIAATKLLTETPTAMAWLLVLNGPQRGRQFRLTETLTIGRGSDNCVVLFDPGISRRHASLCLENNRFYVSDNGSRPGTMVNGVRVKEQELRDRDEIQIGNTTLLFIQAVTPEDLTVEAKRRVREFDSVWEQLTGSVRHDR